MPKRFSRPFEWAPFLLRYTPITLILVLAAAEAWHLWGPISVKDLPTAFDVACTGTITPYRNGRLAGAPQTWQPHYHVDLHRRSVDALYTGKRIHIGSVDRKYGALWLEDDESKAAGHNIVSYFYRENRLAGSLAYEAKGYSTAQVKKATCVRTPAA
jgi:hypothetical protein